MSWIDPELAEYPPEVKDNQTVALERIADQLELIADSLARFEEHGGAR